MTREKYFEITLHLNDIHDLFTAPAVDHYSNKANFDSGIELIKSELKSQSWRSEARGKIRIFLPKENIEPDLAGKTTEALKRYCQFKIWQNKQTMIPLRRDALRALLIGILFLLGGLYFSQVLNTLLGFSFISSLLTYGFDIAFWVVLWRPVDFFLFDLWPYRREDRMYKHIMHMEISVAEEQ
jgi:hypothetical protein